MNVDGAKLHSSIQDNYEKGVKQLLESGIDVNVRDNEGNTPLLAAVIGHRMNIINLLLAQPNIDLDAQNIYGETALICCLQSWFHHSSWDPTTMMCGTPFPFSNTHEYAAVTRELISRGADLNCKDNCMTALHYALINHTHGSCVNIIKFIAKQKHINLDIKNKDGQTPLMQALQQNCCHNIIQSLIDFGSNVSVMNHKAKGQTPLQYTAHIGNAKMTEALLLSGADVNSVDFKGFTALHLAVEGRHKEIVYMLLHYNASVVERTNFANLTAFEMAMQWWRGGDEIIYYLSYYVEDEVIVKSLTTFDIVGSPLFHCCLRLQTGDFFKKFWKRIDHDELIRNYDFLYNYLLDCQFTELEYFECLYMIFESPSINNIIYKFVETRHSIIYVKPYAKVGLELSLEKRIEIFNVFLTHGIPLFYSDIFKLFAKFGIDESVEILLSSGCPIELDDNFPFTYDNLLLSRICFDDMVLRQRANSVLYTYYLNTYCHHPYNEFYMYEITKHRGLCFTSKICSLQQLSRDVVRASIYKRNNKPHAFNAYNAIKSLRLPKLIEGILLLQQPIYGK